MNFEFITSFRESGSGSGSPTSTISALSEDFINFPSPASAAIEEDLPCSPSSPPSPCPSNLTSSSESCASPTDFPPTPKKCPVCGAKMTKQNVARHMLKHRPLVLPEDCVCEACGDSFSVAESCKRHVREGRCPKIRPHDIPALLAKRKADADAKRHKSSRVGRQKRRGKGDSPKATMTVQPDAGTSSSTAFLPTPETAPMVPMSDDLIRMISVLQSHDAATPPSLEPINATTTESSAQNDGMDWNLDAAQYMNLNPSADEDLYSNIFLAQSSGGLGTSPVVVPDAPFELENNLWTNFEAGSQPYQAPLDEWPHGLVYGALDFIPSEVYLMSFDHYDVDAN